MCSVPRKSRFTGLGWDFCWMGGLFGGLFGVLAAWFMGKDGWGWSEGGKLFAWFGCLFWLIVWVIMVVTGGIATFLAFLF